MPAAARDGGRDDARYALLLAGLAAAMACGFCAPALLATRRTAYLHYTDLDLRGHLFSSLPSAAPPPAVFVGSSECLDLLDALRDAENLCTGGGNSATSYAYLSLAARRPLSLVVYVPSPQESVIKPEKSRVVLERPELLDGVLAPRRLERMRELLTGREGVLLRLLWLRKSRRRRMLGFYALSSIQALRRRLYGDKTAPLVVDEGLVVQAAPQSERDIRLSIDEDLRLITGMRALARRAGARYAVVWPPIGAGGEDPQAARERDRLLRSLRAEGVPCFDYHALFAREPDKFLDPTHLNYDGAKAFTRRLTADLAARPREARP